MSLFFKKGKWSLCITVFLLIVSQGVYAQSKDTLKVLFVGNSYTYFWNMPELVSAMAASQDKIIMTRKSTVGGAYWEEHWNDKRGLKTREKIANGHWDIVVLQNNSMSAIENYNKFLKYGKKLVHLVQQTGAKPMLYLTWAREYNPLMQKQVTKAYTTLAKKTGTTVVPVGLIWKEVRNLRPNFRLFHPDETHPSNIGSYLIASIFYAVFTHDSTSAIPERVTTTDKNGEKLYLAILMKNNAGFIHQVVDEYFSSKKDKE